MYWGKFKKSSKKLSRLRFLKVLIFTPLFLTSSANYGKLKTFFLRDNPISKQFSQMPMTSKNVLVQKSIKKRTHTENIIFPSKTQFFFSLTKFKNMAILRLSWRGSTNSKKYIMQLICVKKVCFYPIQVLEMKFLNFWCISQRSKVWWKFPNKMWFFEVWTRFQLKLRGVSWN